MNLNKIARRFAVLTFALTLSVPIMAQDLLARQAPVDKKMKAVDTLELRSILNREYGQSLAAELYNGWSNTNIRQKYPLPETATINLRHFRMPTTSKVVTSNFGYRWGRMHEGMDIKVYTGDTIRAAFSGKVRIVKYNGGGYGKYVVIRHDNGLETLYGHLSKQLVQENQSVRAGEPIGLGGSTGRSSGSHLHFETRLCGVPLNPALMFDFRNQDVVDDYYVFNRNTYKQESTEANRKRGVVGSGSYTREDVTGEKADAVASNRKASEPQASRFHKVVSGETLYSIARKHNRTVDELCRINHLGKKTKVRVGQILKF